MKSGPKFIFMTLLLQLSLVATVASAEEKSGVRLGVNFTLGKLSIDDYNEDDYVMGGGVRLGYDTTNAWGVELGVQSFSSFNFIAELLPLDIIIDKHEYTSITPSYTWFGDSGYLRLRGGLAHWRTEYQVGIDPEKNSLDREDRDKSGNDLVLGAEAGFSFSHWEFGIAYEMLNTDLVDSSVSELLLNYRF